MCDIWWYSITGPMWLTIDVTAQRKWWLPDYESVTKLLSMLQAIWLDKEGHNRILHIIIYIHDIKWLANDPQFVFLRSLSPWHVSKSKQMRDLILICLMVYIQLQISYHVHIWKTCTNPPRSERSISKEFKIYQQ